MYNMYSYFRANDNYDNYPSWFKCENYFYCENFSRILSYFKKR